MPLGRMLITIGVVLVGMGLLFSFGARLPFRIGRLPGDIYIQGKNSSFYFPLATCIVLSILLSVVMWIVRKF
jgi:ABC-type Fe3+ transport system permease subunit